MQNHGGEHPGISLPLDNRQIAARLDEVAGLLENQQANLFRVRAYRSAAQFLLGLDQQVHSILDAEGIEGLERLPGIGESLSRSIERLARTGRLGLLQRLRGQSGPEHQFTTLPGIGLEMASRIHETLGIETLQELESAALDGRLSQVPGMGAKRIQGVRDALAGRFHRPAVLAPQRSMAAGLSSVAELLEIDAEYQRNADAGRLPRIAPQRLNPSGDAWLPVLHAERGERHYTALFSNTAHAHQLGMTHDWVVIYRDDHGGHGQWTVITAQFGPLRGKRIVRGREAECVDYYKGLRSKEVQGTLFPNAKP